MSERKPFIAMCLEDTRVEANAFSGCPLLEAQCHRDTFTHRNLTQVYHGPIRFYEGEATE